MSKETIWSFFKRNTPLNDFAIAGIMGNFEAESNCEACRLQGDFSPTRQTSRRYADMVNSGTMAEDAFITDSKGWGLAQWTYYTRKQNLLHSCRSQGKGIEDETAQLQFFLAEIQSEYGATWKALLSATNIEYATYAVLHNYERPAVENLAQRVKYATAIHDQFAAWEPPADDSFRQQMILFLEEEKDRIQAKINELKGVR